MRKYMIIAVAAVALAGCGAERGKKECKMLTGPFAEALTDARTAIGVAKEMGLDTITAYRYDGFRYRVCFWHKPEGK